MAHASHVRIPYKLGLRVFNYVKHILPLAHGLADHVQLQGELLLRQALCLSRGSDIFTQYGRKASFRLRHFTELHPLPQATGINIRQQYVDKQSAGKFIARALALCHIGPSGLGVNG